MPRKANESGRLTYTRDMRIRRRADFEAAYEANVRRSAGPLLIYARPNEHPHCRLGMAVSRRVGTAVRRNAIKRRLREAFRGAQHDLPKGYDFVISVRPHEPMKTAEYSRLLLEAARALHARWTRKAETSERRPPPGRSSDS